MRGRCSRSSLNCSTSNGECSALSHEVVHLSSSDEEKLELQLPHRIVIGFDLAADSSRILHSSPAACESPRSVLEPHHPCFRSQHQQVRCPRSPLSALGSLLSGNPRNISCAEGAALCNKAVVEAEEAVASVNSQHALGLVTGNVDSFPAFLKRENAVADYCKTDKQGSSLSFTRTNCAEARRNQSSKRGPSDRASTGSCGKCSPPKTVSSVVGEDEDNNEAAPVADAGNGDVMDILPEPVFSTASPVANYHWSDTLAVDFLNRCCLCRRRLLLGKDIFMYRGDQAFCSMECRYKQIVVDERKERRPVAGTRVPGAFSHHQSSLRANQAAFA